jgi:hypothetical protein
MLSCMKKKNFRKFQEFFFFSSSSWDRFPFLIGARPYQTYIEGILYESSGATNPPQPDPPQPTPVPLTTCPAPATDFTITNAQIYTMNSVNDPISGKKKNFIFLFFIFSYFYL